MAPEEIVEHIDGQNRRILHARRDCEAFSRDDVLELMNVAAMRSFRFGSESALSLVKSKLVLKYLDEATASDA